MPIKTIYVSDNDTRVFDEATHKSGGNLSATIVNALRDYVSSSDAIQAGFDQIQVKIGSAVTRIVNFMGIRLKFYQRIKAGKKVLGRKGGKQAREFSAGRHAIWVYGHRMNLVVTPEPDVRLKTSGKAKEPWYIVTNDLEASAGEVTEIYYHRFEIEEVFKDAKRLFGLEWIAFKKPERLVTVLWFVCLGMWLHSYLESTVRVSREVVQKTKQSFGQGRTHYWLEKIRFELQAQALETITI